MTQVRDGGTAVVVQHCAVFGRLEHPVRKFHVGDVRPYAQYDRSVCISFVEPRKRNGRYIQMTPDGIRFATIEINGRTVYDSRHDVPMDMGKWRETSARFTHYEVTDLTATATATDEGTSA
jgi:hypothetical protein